jgi:hypothetical protein
LLMRRSGFAWKVWNDPSNPRLPAVVPIASHPVQLSANWRFLNYLDDWL